MNAWKEYRLGDHCLKIGSGSTPRGGGDTYLSAGEFALIRSQNVLDFNFSTNGLAYISQEQADKLKNVEVKESDILLNITGDSVARVCQVRKDVLPARVNQHVAIIRPNSEKIDPEFLKYYLLQPSFKNYMLMLSGAGATRNALTKGMIESFNIKAPNLPTQTAIAEILSSLDDKIELNNQINQNLEALAQALFKRWFVDFEFPNENGQPYKSSGGEMVESLIGLFPNGWNITSLLNFVNLIGGGTPKTSMPNYWNGEIKWLSAKDVTANDKTFVLFTEKLITKEGLDNSSAKLLPQFSTVISARGTVGNYCITSEPGMTISQSNYALKNPDSFDFYTYLMVGTLISEMKQRSYGTVFDTITTKTLADIKVINPPKQIISSFEKIVAPFYEAILNNCNETLGLQKLRDILLPKLISGELEIKQAKEILQEI